MSVTCAACRSSGCDLRLTCGCNFHVICLPLSLVLDTQRETNTVPLGPRKDGSIQCPTCYGSASGIQLFPLKFDALKRSIELRVEEAAASGRGIYSSSPIAEATCGVKRDRDIPKELLEVEAAHAVFAQGKHGASGSGEGDARRTGRWTDDEMEYVDHLIKQFDHGKLPLAHGTKLSNFLCDAILCKASRLTKKMKNAKLSTRNFKLQTNTLQTNANLQDAHIMKTLEDRFVSSMSTEYSRLEFEFNLSMHWRTCLSDLCVQVGYPFLNGSSFIQSLEDYERLASNADEGMRSVRRRRMVGGLASNTPSGAEAPPRTTDLLAQLASKTPNEPTILPGRVSLELPNEVGIPSIDVFPDDSGHELFASENFHDSLTGIFEGDEGCGHEGDRTSTRFRTDSAGDPFLDVIANYLEEMDLPFQHADFWVPSFVNSDDDNEVRLLHAGAVTRRDQDGERWSAFESFGVYSRSFSFLPGRGLVGRVYAVGKPMWEFGLNKLDPEFFLRAGGAEEYGVRTAVGIPFSTAGVGRMVIVLYSCNHIPENAMIAFNFAKELAQYAPAPKWKLVVEISGEDSDGDKIQSSGERPASMDEIPPPGQETVSRGSRSEVVSPLDGSRSVLSDDEVIENIVTLIGEQLSRSNDFEDPALFHHLMRIRLRLLRPSTRRSSDENDKIDVLRNSYRNYSAGNRRSGKEVAILLAKEWLVLSEASNSHPEADDCERDDLEPNPIAMQSSGQYTSHEFSPSLQPLDSYKGSSPNFEKVMRAPPLQLPDSLGNTPGSNNHQGKSIVVIDHSNNQMPPFPKSTPTPLFAPGMPRTVSCAMDPPPPSTCPSGNGHNFQRSNSFMRGQPNF